MPFIASVRNINSYSCSETMESSKEKDSVKGRSSHPDVFCEKGALKNFVKFTVENFYWSKYF